MNRTSKTRALLTSSALVLITSSTMVWADVERGLQAKEAGDFPTALAEFRSSADSGDPQAMLELARLYRTGEAVPADPTVYLDLLRRSAEQGYGPAENELGMYYAFQANDVATALAWFERAAAGGNADGLMNTGYMYENGVGVAADGARAVAAYERAFELGRVEAGYQLGVMFYNGKNVAKDIGRAAGYFKQGAEMEDAKSEFFLAYLYRQGEGVEQDIEKSNAYRLKAAESGLLRAQLEVAEEAAGYFVSEPDYETGIKWYEAAAKQGDLDGITNLLRLYRDTQNVLDPRDDYVPWLRKASDMGHAASQWELAGRLSTGAGVIRDLKKSVAMAITAAESGHVPAQLEIGRGLLYGRGLEQDYPRGFGFLYGAASQYDGHAMQILAQIFYDGDGVEENLPVAYMFAKSAVANQNLRADKLLRRLSRNMKDHEVQEAQEYLDRCSDFPDCIIRKVDLRPALQEAIRPHMRN